MMRKFAALIVAGSIFTGLQASADPIPMQAFFDGSRIKDAAISPDGRYLSAIVVMSGRHLVMVTDRTGKVAPKAVMSGDSDKRTNPTWCGWANNTRLLCGYRGVGLLLNRYIAFSRLVAVDADGTNPKLLRQTNNRGSTLAEYIDPQFQDQIIDWTPDDPDTVLMLEDDDLDGFPGVVALDVYSGMRRQFVARQHKPIFRFITDGYGNLRLGWGLKDTEFFYYALLEGESEWRQLSKIEAFSRQQNEDTFDPVAVISGTNFAYAMKNNGDRRALWQIDLQDKREPEVLFELPTVDVGKPLFSPTRKLLGVAYTTDRLAVYYTDPKRRAYVAALNKVLPHTINTLVDVTHDERYFIVKATSDVVPPEYYVLDTTDNKLVLQKIGSSYPGLKSQQLAPMRTINYPVKDGTIIPGYLTVPLGSIGENLPLVVMPHGGPITRDTWGFDPRVQFLASRGYAVLQMNFRGSSGYGSEWYWAAHQDWGGLTYSDITDGTRWAIAQGIADPKRICIVGAGFLWWLRCFVRCNTG